MSHERLLKILLRAAGVVSCLALAAVVMPRGWMAFCHERLGLGTFPAGPIVEYLARSVSALYALFGGLCLLVSFDVRRHRAVIAYLAVTHAVLGVVLLLIDLHVGMPGWWAAVEFGQAVGFALAVLLLLRGLSPRP